MAQSQTLHFSDRESQRQLLLSGQYNTLFNDLTLNLPYRFLIYSRPETLTPFFESLHEQLDSAKVRFCNQDAWTFDSIINIIAPDFRITGSKDVLDFLIRTCSIPEGHLNFDRNKQIYLSRYALSLLTNTLSKQSKALRNDLSAELLTHADTENFNQGKEKFLTEIQLIFANYYSSHIGADTEELSYNTWMWVRGEQLRTEYAKSTMNLRTIIMKYLKYHIDPEIIDKELLTYKERCCEIQDEAALRKHIEALLEKNFTESNVETFKQRFIFNTLFQKENGMPFKTQYEDALRSFGYTLSRKNPDNLDEPPKWRRRDLVAPKYPGAHFQPDLSFFMSWTINKFCEFVENERNQTNVRNVNKWFENVTQRFFSTLKDGLITVNQNQFDGKYDLINSSKFIDQHHYRQAHKIVVQVRDGEGRKKLDRRTREKVSETPGTLEFWKNHNLFSDDDAFCRDMRLSAEYSLKKLHAAYLKTPSLELAKKISDKEQAILDENMALYGHNFQAFVSVPVTLNENGEFIHRPILGPNKVVRTYNLPLEKLETLNPKSPQLALFESDLQILSDDKIKRGQPVLRGSFTNPKNERIDYFKLDPNGTYQTVNPLVAKPTVLNKHGRPRLVRENVQMCNFCLESDTLSLAEQQKIVQWLVSLNVINLVVFSGNKSLHIIITIKDAPKTIDEYKWLFFYLGMKFGLVQRTWNAKINRYKYTGDVDLSMCNPNHCMRRPGAMRIIDQKNSDGSITQHTVEQKLLYRSNAIYDINWRPVYEEDIKHMATLIQKPYRIKPHLNTYRDINSFMQNYIKKHFDGLIAIQSGAPFTTLFEQGNGHNIGCRLIGAAKTAGFSAAEINDWFRVYCDRYDELINGWRDLIGRQILMTR